MLGGRQREDDSVPVCLQGNRSHGLFDNLLYLETFHPLQHLSGASVRAEEKAPHDEKAKVGSCDREHKAAAAKKAGNSTVSDLRPFQVFLLHLEGECFLPVNKEDLDAPRRGLFEIDQGPY